MLKLRAWDKQDTKHQSFDLQEQTQDTTYLKYDEREVRANTQQKKKEFTEEQKKNSVMWPSAKSGLMQLFLMVWTSATDN